MNYSFNVQMSTVKEYSGFNKNQGQSNIFLYKQNIGGTRTMEVNGAICKHYTVLHTV